MVMHLPCALAAVSPAVNDILGGQFRYCNPDPNPISGSKPSPEPHFNRHPESEATALSKTITPPIHSPKSIHP